MGLDLMLCPYNRPEPYGKRGSDWHLATTRLNLDRDYDLFGQIRRTGRSDVRQVCNPKPLPASVRFEWYADEGLKAVTTDPYGDPLAYVTAGELASVDLRTNAGAWNKAAFAYIRQLPPDTPVVLWWH